MEAKEKERFDQFWLIYERYFVGVAKRYSRDRNQTEDYVSEAALKICLTIPRLASRTDLKGVKDEDRYLQKAGVNAIIDAVRKTQRVATKETGEEEYTFLQNAASPDKQSEMIASLLAVEALEYIQPELRIILVYWAYGHTNQEAADSLDIDKNEYKNALKRARASILRLRSSQDRRKIIDMATLTDRIKVPNADAINSGLSSPRSDFMISIFGNPRKIYGSDCGEVTNKELKKEMVYGVSVGPFRVSGHKLAVESLKRIFARVKLEEPELYKAVGSAGMLCARAIRGTKSTPSNHSFGTAIDLTINGKLDAVGDGFCQSGLLILYKYFRAEGWYWGAEYKGPREDAMHWEVSKEKILEWRSAKLV